MKLLLIKFIFVTLIISAAAYFLLKNLTSGTLSREDNSSHVLLLKKIEEMGNLQLVKFSFSDIVEEEIKRKILSFDNLAPDSKVLLFISGEATACIDLLKVKEADIITETDMIIIKLPPPEICYARIKHEESKVYHMNLTARILNPELVEKGYKNAEKHIRDEAIKEGILEQAETTAVKLLLPLLETISGKTVIIEINNNRHQLNQER